MAYMPVHSPNLFLRPGGPSEAARLSQTGNGSQNNTTTLLWHALGNRMIALQNGGLLTCHSSRRKTLSRNAMKPRFGSGLTPRVAQSRRSVCAGAVIGNMDCHCYITHYRSMKLSSTSLTSFLMEPSSGASSLLLSRHVWWSCTRRHD
jgi:hypothetical protein